MNIIDTDKTRISYSPASDRDDELTWHKEYYIDISEYGDRIVKVIQDNKTMDYIIIAKRLNHDKPYIVYDEIGYIKNNDNQMIKIDSSYDLKSDSNTYISITVKFTLYTTPQPMITPQQLIGRVP